MRGKGEGGKGQMGGGGKCDREREIITEMIEAGRKLIRKMREG